MAKVAPPRRKSAQQRSTNWVLIGVVGAVGVIGLFALLFVTLQSEGVPTPTVEPVPLAEFCEDNAANCVEKGDADAPVTVVEISDYGCPHCKNFNSGTAQALDEAYVASGDVRWIVMPFALSANTRPAAEAALCAADQDAFSSFTRKCLLSRGRRRQ